LLLQKLAGAIAAGVVDEQNLLVKLSHLPENARNIFALIVDGDGN
jgi:hypothetical protein